MLKKGQNNHHDAHTNSSLEHRMSTKRQAYVASLVQCKSLWETSKFVELEF
jgi:hypothetical protein